MSRSKGCGTAEDACCQPETKMVQYAVRALDQMNDMLQLTLNPQAPGTCRPKAHRGGQTERDESGGCDHEDEHQYAKQTQDVFARLCAWNQTSAAAAESRDSTSWDRNVMRLKPGEVGLWGDQATFHLGTGGEVETPKTGHDGRPTGAVYYHIPPKSAKTQDNEPTRSREPAQDNYTQRKHVMQVLPALPVTTNSVVGPVTGLPMDGDEDVFVLRVGKRFDESDDLTRLQVEVRLPKAKDPTEIATQYKQEDFMLSAVSAAPAAKGKKGKGKKGKGKKGKGKKGKGKGKK